MVTWICGVSLKDHIPSADLLNTFKDVLRWNRLRNHGHLTCMEDVWPKWATLQEIIGKQPKGRPCSYKYYRLRNIISV